MAPLPLDTAQRNRLVALLAARDALATPLKRRNTLDEAGLEALHTSLELSGDAESFAGQLLRQSWEADPALYRALLAWLRHEVRGHTEEAAFVDALLAAALDPPAPPRAAPPVQRPTPRPAAPPTQRPTLPQATPSVAPVATAPLQATGQQLACERKAQRWARFWFIVLAVDIFVLAMGIILLLAYGVPILEPLANYWPYIGAAFALLIYALIGRGLPSREEIHGWLLRRQRRHLKCEPLDDILLPVQDTQAPSPTPAPTLQRSNASTLDQRAADAVPPDGEAAYLARRAGQEPDDITTYFTTLRGQTKLPVVEAVYVRRNPELHSGKRTVDATPTPFTDITAEIEKLPHAILVGQPGSGKTTTFLALDSAWRNKLSHEAQAALPCFIRLKNWTDAALSFESFLDSQLPELRPLWPTLSHSPRLRLLLDGLDQIPPAQRRDKAEAIKTWAKAHPHARLYVSCRQADLDGQGIEFDYPRIEIKELEPSRIQAYIRRYVLTNDGATPAAEQKAATIFWQVAGGEEVHGVWKKWEQAGAIFEQFWSATEIPQQNPSVYSKTSVREDAIWHEKVRTPYSLMELAQSPYMLLMMIGIYDQEQELPRNRGDLFQRFVTTLLLRESDSTVGATLAQRPSPHAAIEILPAGHALLGALQGMAYAMQAQRTLDSEGGSAALVAIAEDEAVPRWLSVEQRAQAIAANLLTASDGKLSFTHQLLQEYFAARQLLREVQAGKLDATRIWPRDTWWERTGWEVTAELLAGLEPKAVTPLVRWLARANPLVAMESVANSGAEMPDRASLAEILKPWQPLLTDVKREANPHARAAIGRALALAGVDDRRGIGLRADGVPDIAWVRLEGGDFPIGGDERAWDGLPKRDNVPVAEFAMSKYPVTNAQWDAFLNAPDGYEDERWWRELAGGKQQPTEPRWHDSNHPRESVNWYEAVAFCRWLTHKLKLPDGSIRLPTEIEWERAARGKEGRLFAWGDTWDSAKANTYKGGTGRTSPVGIYPLGATPDGLHEMAGNVWEWTSTAWAKEGGGSDNIMSSAARVLRGGSWLVGPQVARACSRGNWYPQSRGVDWGFRLVGPAVVTL